jgi:hypothetical protein
MEQDLLLEIGTEKFARFIPGALEAKNLTRNDFNKAVFKPGY